jgi:hypothetical protein
MNHVCSQKHKENQMGERVVQVRKLDGYSELGSRTQSNRKIKTMSKIGQRQNYG